MSPSRHTGVAHLEAALAEIEEHRRTVGARDQALAARLRRLADVQDPEQRRLLERTLAGSTRYQDGLVLAASILRRHLAEYHAHHPSTQRPTGS